MSGPAAERPVECVQHDGLHVIVACAGGFESLLYCQDLNHVLVFQFRAISGRLVSMQLQSADAGFGSDSFDRIRRVFVDEDADGEDIKRELIDDGTRELRINVTRAGTIEIKTQCVRARVDRNKRVLKVSNAADLYQHKGSRRQSA